MRRFGAALGLAVVLGAGVGAPQARALPNPALAAPTARPAELPIEQPTEHQFIVNLKTARTLGLAIPESILLRAHEVIR